MTAINICSGVKPWKICHRQVAKLMNTSQASEVGDLSAQKIGGSFRRDDNKKKLVGRS